MLAVNPPNISFSDASLLRRLLISVDWRPNVLIMCDGVSADDTIDELQLLSVPGLHHRRIPGPLDLPVFEPGTLLLHDVSRLTIVQQVALSDWLSYRGGMRVLSVSAAPLKPLIEDGRFLEGLFYRLNVVTVRATAEHGRARC